VWEELPSDIKMQLEESMGVAGRGESKANGAASLFGDSDADQALPEQERKVLAQLRRDEAMQLDELIEALEQQMGSPEIFAALFELELRGRVKQMPGKNYVRCF
jgi:DNA processing protein